MSTAICGVTKRHASESSRRRASKRGASDEKEAESDRAARKRVQNRISQKCIREKQAAQTQHLAAFWEMIQSSRNSNGDNSTALMEAHLKLLEDNQKMKTALLRMRKKLLSISNSAAAAASMCSFA